MHTDAKRYYAVLGVEPGCSDDMLRAAFRRRAKEAHPDAETGSANAFIRLKRAYDVLCDPAKRARYDRACTPAPRRAPAPRFAPPPRARRRVPFFRYAAAFLVMAAISLGGVEWMISANSDAPTRTRIEPVDSLLSPGAPRSAESGQKYDGIWDPTAPNQRRVSRPVSPPIIAAPAATE